MSLTRINSSGSESSFSNLKMSGFEVSKNLSSKNEIPTQLSSKNEMSTRTLVEELNRQVVVVLEPTELNQTSSVCAEEAVKTNLASDANLTNQKMAPNIDSSGIISSEQQQQHSLTSTENPPSVANQTAPPGGANQTLTPIGGSTLAGGPSPHDVINLCPYFFGKITREVTEWILFDRGACADGLFLVRESSSSSPPSASTSLIDADQTLPDLVLSLCYNKT